MTPVSDQSPTGEDAPAASSRSDASAVPERHTAKPHPENTMTRDSADAVEVTQHEYRKTATIRASQWWKMGDHPAVVPIGAKLTVPVNPTQGWCPTLEGGHVVTPGDWIATGIQGEHWPIKADIFEATYAPVNARRLSALSAIPSTSDVGAGQREAITVNMLGEVMQDAWGEICDDSGAHPLDINRVHGVTWYNAGHWTDLIALRLNERLAALRTDTPSPSEAMVERLREALQPSAATKAAYIGEFSFLIDIEHEGEEITRKLDVPWTTIKEIMAAIRIRAALTDEVKP